MLAAQPNNSKGESSAMAIPEAFKIDVDSLLVPRANMLRAAKTKVETPQHLLTPGEAEGALPAEATSEPPHSTAPVEQGQ